MRNLKLTLFTLLFTSQLIGCASFPQTYDSPIPVYVDLGDIKATPTRLNTAQPTNTSKLINH